jgi:tetratricopeptide (TPR) repeat protein
MRAGEIPNEVKALSTPPDGVQNLRKELDWKEALQLVRADSKKDKTPKYTEEEIKEIEDGAHQAYKKGDYAKAEKKFREVLNSYPKLPSFGIVPIGIEVAQTLLARSMSKQGKYAGPEFDKAIDFSSRPDRWSTDDKRIKEALEESRILKSGELLFEKGLNALTCKDKPNAKEATKAFSDAINKFQSVKEKAAELPEAYEHRAIAKAKQQDVDGALEDLEKAKELRKDHPKLEKAAELRDSRWESLGKKLREELKKEQKKDE